MRFFCETKIWVVQTKAVGVFFTLSIAVTGIAQTSHAAPCSRPKDFSNRAATELYDRCIEKNKFIKVQKSPEVLEKISCLHAKPNELIACRKKELSGESIKAVSVAVFGATPTPAPGLKPLDGDVPVEDNSQKKNSNQAAPTVPGGPVAPITNDPPPGGAGAPMPPQPGAAPFPQ